MDVEVNYLAVVLGMVAAMAAGALWYSKPLFLNQWATLAKVDLLKQTGKVKPLGTAIVASLLTAYVLAHVSYTANKFMGNSFLVDTLTTAFWLWLGLAAARIALQDGFESRPVKLTAITLGHELLAIMVMGLVIGLFGV